MDSQVIFFGVISAKIVCRQITKFVNFNQGGAPVSLARNSAQAGSAAVSFVQKRFGFGHIIAQGLNLRLFCFNIEKGGTNMLKIKIKQTVFFSVFLFLVLVLPQVSLAVNYYQGQAVNEKGQFITGKLYEVCYEGIVPCGKEVLYVKCDNSGDCLGKGDKGCVGGALSKGILHCQLCHFFVMINQTINYLFLSIIPYVAVFMFVVAGVFFYLGGARPEFKTRGKSIVRTVAIGLALIYGAFLIVGVFLTVLGAAKIEPISSVWQGSVFKINCPVRIPEGILQ